MAISKTAGAKLYISPTAVDTDTINAMTDENAVAFFEAINDWVEVEEVEEYGELGDTSEEITFTAVGNRRVRKLKGPRNAGTQAIAVGRDPLDDGQEALVAAEATDFNYPIKIELSDARSASYSDSVLFYAGLVMSKPTSMGNVSAVTRRNFNVGINTAVFEVASGALAAPANLVLPSISGIAQVGETLTAIEGSWSNNPTSYQYQWQENDSGWADIAGAISKTYDPVVGNVGNPLRVVVTAVNGAGNASATSGETGAVLAE